MKTMLSRHRRLLAALFAAVAAALALSTAHNHPAGVRVLVASRDLSSGTVLRRADVMERSFPPGTVPSGTLHRAEGRVLSAPMRRGEPLTDTRIATGTLPLAHDPAAVAVPIRLADAAVAHLLHPGDRVDVLAARADTPVPARTVASAVPVIAVPRPNPDSDDGALIVVQTGRDQAASLARASADSRLSIAILGS